MLRWGHSSRERCIGVTLETTDERVVVCCEGAVGIACAAELKGLLLEALGSGKEVRVSLEGAICLDVTAVQLLWAAERQAKGAGIGYAVLGEVPEGLLAAVSAAGFERFPVPEAAN